MPEDKRSSSLSFEADGRHDEFIEPNTQAFVVKIWLENPAGGAEQVIWRSHITHVASGQRRYLTNLRGIHDFFASYLYKMGVRPPLFWRLRSRLGFTKEP